MDGLLPGEVLLTDAILQNVSWSTPSSQTVLLLRLHFADLTTGYLPIALWLDAHHKLSHQVHLWRLQRELSWVAQSYYPYPQYLEDGLGWELRNTKGKPLSWHLLAFTMQKMKSSSSSNKANAFVIFARPFKRCHYWYLARLPSYSLNRLLFTFHEKNFSVKKLRESIVRNTFPSVLKFMDSLFLTSNNELVQT